MTKSVRLLVLAAASLAGVLAVTDDAFGGIFRRRNNCNTGCATTCSTGCNIGSSCATGGCNTCGYAATQSSCCGGTVLATASTAIAAPPAGVTPMPLPPGTTTQPVAPVTIAPAPAIGATACGSTYQTASVGCDECAPHGRRFRLFRRN